MAPFDRAELDEMVQRWVDENKRCEALGDWKPLAEMYTEDATYGWNYGPKDDFMAVGRDEIRDLALGQEMDGLKAGNIRTSSSSSTTAAATSSDSGSRCPNAPGTTAPTIRSPGSAAAGSGTAETSNGPGSVTSSTSATSRACSSR